MFFFSGACLNNPEGSFISNFFETFKNWNMHIYTCYAWYNPYPHIIHTVCKRVAFKCGKLSFKKSKMKFKYLFWNPFKGITLELHHIKVQCHVSINLRLKYSNLYIHIFFLTNFCLVNELDHFTVKLANP